MLKNHTLTAAGLVALALTAGSCSSTQTNNPPAPGWISQPARTVDNGYIVYVGTGDDTSPERAQFKAEGLALQDLANECSFAPKGTRVEDRYVKREGNLVEAYAKVGIEFQQCDEAKKAVEPAAIRDLANPAFTEQIKKYQDILDEGPPEEVAEGKPLDLPKESSPNEPIHDDVHFFVVRQYVAWQKEVVILSPPAAYPPNSEQSVAFVKRVQPVSTEINHYEVSNPDIKKTPLAWSHIEKKPAAFRPRAFSQNRTEGPKAVKPPPNRGRVSHSTNSGPKPTKVKRRRHHGDSF